ncbi:MAG: hypothetical protein LBL82_00915 [Oscillospiraceae bacterium]|jgi:uncharacterized integral membrane protein|nr:hypothetical protein [Oscillospiraceae bacterium]
MSKKKAVTKIEQVEVTVTLTSGDRFQAEKIYFQKRRKSRMRRRYLVFGLALLFPVIWLMFNQYNKITLSLELYFDAPASAIEPILTAFRAFVIVIFVIAGAGTVYLALRRRALRRRFRRGLDRRAALCTYTFDRFINIKTPSDETIMRYDEVSEIIEDFYGLLIVPYRGDVIYLPTRVLYGEELKRATDILYNKTLLTTR